MQTLFKHQRDAIQAILKGFSTEERGQLRMACGTGKTFTSLKLAEAYVGTGNKLLFLTPSLALMNQIISEWKQLCSIPISCFAVCSDNNVAIHNLEYPANTNANDLKNALLKADCNNMIAIFATYHSIDIIHKAELGTFSLIICDEAHRTTGQIDNEDISCFARIHDNNYIKATKCLYMTATPRIYAGTQKNKCLFFSMDDKTIYGKVFYNYSFEEAVNDKILSDYKLSILTISEAEIQEKLKDAPLSINHSAKLLACWKAITTQHSHFNKKKFTSLQKLIAFCPVIDASQSKGKKPPLGSKQVVQYFNIIANKYSNGFNAIKCELQHIDGTMNATEKAQKICWLQENSKHNICRILTNVRCLSEGVDIPSLDGIIFLHPRNSIIDIIQALGRVMRKSPGKKYGHIILPIVIPHYENTYLDINKNESYKIIWQVLQALRAHDERLAAELQLGAHGAPTNHLDIICYRDFNNENLPTKDDNKVLKQVICQHAAKAVGDKQYWEKWAKDTAAIVQNLIKEITKLLVSDAIANKIFNKFLGDLGSKINNKISKKEGIELLAQHYVVSPILNSLFENYNFVANNAIANDFEIITKQLQISKIHKHYSELNKFYESVKIRAKAATHPALRQQLILELFDSFYKIAFPKMVERLGIVFTPVEVIDFILAKVNDALKIHFNESYASKQTRIIEPFAGTGTFITRLLHSDMLTADQAVELYKNRLFANELVLLSYYIATINIENSLHERTKFNYIPFPGIALTDSFNDITKNTNINVIIGNPPYSKGQKNSNDNNKNIKHPKLENSIKATYAKDCPVTYKNALYDSYVKAFRWATDHIGNKGIIGFITGNAILEKQTMAGLRKHFAQDFSDLYFINLRGNIRKNIASKYKSMEGENIFGSGSMSGICISILVKNPLSSKKGNIYYYDIGDNLTAKEKNTKLKQLPYLKEINWQQIKPNAYYEWLNKRDEKQELFAIFKKYVPISTIFAKRTLGIFSARNAWVYNYSKSKLAKNMQATIAFYNAELKKTSITINPKKIKWTIDLEKKLKRNITAKFEASKIVPTIYKPFTSTNLYYDNLFNDRLCQIPKIFPNGTEENKIIIVTAKGANSEFSTLISNKIPYIQLMDNPVCYPLYLYKDTKKFAILEKALAMFQAPLQQKITQTDLFYYIYAVLHSPNYKQKFSNILNIEEPHIPIAKSDNEFTSFSQAGQQLSDLHLNYENGPIYEHVQILLNNKIISLEELKKQPSYIFYLKKMKRKNNDIIYNSYITIINIPPQTFEYKIVGRSAIDWVINQQKISIDSKTGIINDANDYAAETIGNPAYVLELLLRVIYISIETEKIINNLPSI